MRAAKLLELRYTRRKEKMMMNIQSLFLPFLGGLGDNSWLNFTCTVMRSCNVSPLWLFSWSLSIVHVDPSKPLRTLAVIEGRNSCTSTFGIGTSIGEDKLLESLLLNDFHLIVVEVVCLVDLFPLTIGNANLL